MIKLSNSVPSIFQCSNFVGIGVVALRYVQKTHLIADTEGHLGNLDIDEGVVHSSSLLHLIDVINRMLEKGNCKMQFNLFILFCS